MAIEYNVYASGAPGSPVDYSAPVASGISALSYATAPLTPGTSTTFAVRSYDPATGLDDGNTDATVTITLDSSGNDVSAVPPPPTSIVAIPTAGGAATIQWGYPYPGQINEPTGFHVYVTAGSSVDYATPTLTVVLAGAGTRPTRFGLGYRTTVSGLASGTSYKVGVRAFNASGTEGNTLAVSLLAATAPPLNVANLTATLTSG